MKAQGLRGGSPVYGRDPVTRADSQPGSPGTAELAALAMRTAMAATKLNLGGWPIRLISRRTASPRG